MDTLQKQIKLNPHYVIQQSNLNIYYQQMQNAPKSVYQLVQKKYAKREEELSQTLNLVSCIAVAEPSNNQCCTCGSCFTEQLPYRCPNCQLHYCNSLCGEKHMIKCNKLFK